MTMSDEQTNETAAPAKEPKRYVVAAEGISFGGDRNENGDEYTGPAKSIPWLVEQGALQEVK
jgi:hypothetical protein